MNREHGRAVKGVGKRRDISNVLGKSIKALWHFSQKCFNDFMASRASYHILFSFDISSAHRDMCLSMYPSLHTHTQAYYATDGRDKYIGK